MTLEQMKEIGNRLYTIRLAKARKKRCASTEIAETLSERLLAALETERARLDTLAKLRPGELFDALSDPRGLRAALDERIAARGREKGAEG